MCTQTHFECSHTLCPVYTHERRTQRRSSVTVAMGFSIVDLQVERRAVGMPLLKELFHCSLGETCKTAGIASGSEGGKEEEEQKRRGGSSPPSIGGL